VDLKNMKRGSERKNEDKDICGANTKESKLEAFTT